MSITSGLPYINKIPSKALKRWERYYILAIVVKLSAYFVVPFVSLFLRTEERTDRMKRVARERGENTYKQYTRKRWYLLKIFNWYQTHDNAQCEYFYGDYDDMVFDFFKVDTEMFEKSNIKGWLLRYYACVRWGWRNKSYGFFYSTLGVTQIKTPVVFERGKEDSGEQWVRIEIFGDKYFKYESQEPNGKGEYRSRNFGYKRHDSALPLSDGTLNDSYAVRLWSTLKNYD